PEAVVWAIDVNNRALELCAENARRLGLDNVRVARPEHVPEDVAFAAVYSNPPIRIGKTPLHDLLATWLGRLAPRGHGYFVVQRLLGAASLAAWLRSAGFDVQRLGSRQAYRLLDVWRAP